MGAIKRKNKKQKTQTLESLDLKTEAEGLGGGDLALNTPGY